MKTWVRLTLYGVTLLAAFGLAFLIGGAVVPATTVAKWVDAASESHAMTDTASEAEGLARDAAGYLLTDVSAPTELSVASTLAVGISEASGHGAINPSALGSDGVEVIAVRADGVHYRAHALTHNSDTGLWQAPWTWEAAGTYRIYVTFTPESGEAVTLSSTVQVDGQFDAARLRPARIAEVNGLTVTLAGDLAAGNDTQLTFGITRAGELVSAEEVTHAHLTILRDGDLAPVQLRAHQGESPLAFSAKPSTPGRHLVYLEFTLDGDTNTATFVVDAAHTAASNGGGKEDSDDQQ